MLHELPPNVRRTVIGEAARVLKPGGRLILLDSLQLGDEPDYDGMLERFPQLYHEPYYKSYVREDFTAIARCCGLGASERYQGLRFQGDGVRQAESLRPTRWVDPPGAIFKRLHKSLPVRNGRFSCRRFGQETVFLLLDGL
jgi:ubiquinone/menaquinone biosynthesis C-methylase UbiE